MGGTGCPVGKTFFLHCQRRHPELPKIPTYLPRGGIERLQRPGSLFLLHIRESNHLWWFMSHRNILWWTISQRHHRSRILLVLFPLRRHPLPLTWSKWTASRTWFDHPVMGVGGRGHTSSGGVPAPVAARPTSPICPAGGPCGPSVAGGAAGAGGGGSSPPLRGGGPWFRHAGGPMKHGGRIN